MNATKRNLPKARLALPVCFAVFATWVITSCSQPENTAEQEISSDEDAGSTSPSLVWDVSLWGNQRAGTKAPEVMAELVEARTDGAWRMRLHYGEAISKARENLDGIAIGAFEAAMVCNFYHPQKNPALMVLTLPFLPMSTDQTNLAVRKAVYEHDAVVAEFAQWGAMLYTSTYLPQYEIMGRGQPPHSIEDWQGMTVRAGGGIGQAMRLLGATPNSSTATEVYTGVQQGTMDAASFPFTYGHVSYRIHEVSDWFTLNLAPGSADCPIVFAKSAYEKLPESYTTLLSDIRDEVDSAQLKAYRDVDDVNLPMLRESLEEVSYSAEDLDRLRDTVGKQVIEAWIEDNQDEFDARGLVELAFSAAGQTYD